MISHAGVDTATYKLTGAMLKAADKAFCCRYVKNAPGSSFDKQMRRTELVEKTAHGVRVVANWEWAEAPTNARSTGRDHAQECKEMLASLGVPPWARIYYSIDSPQQAHAYDNYATGWLDVYDPKQLGSYTCGALFRQLLADEFITRAWQSMSRAYPGNHLPGQPDVWDHRGADIIQTRRTTIGGFDCDLDTAVIDDYGGFLLGEDDPMTITPDDIKTIAAEVVRQLKADPQWIDLTWRTKAIADLDAAFLNGSMKGAPVELTKAVKAIPTTAAPAAPLGAAELAAIAKAVNDESARRQAS